MSSTGSATYSNMVVTWTASTTQASLNVIVKSGGTLIGDMTFTPTTLNNNLNYSNPPQSASGLFSAQFGPDGTSGTLSCSGFKWSVTSGDGGPITGLVGVWDAST